jgi:tRNA-specific 2-thiouridylase
MGRFVEKDLTVAVGLSGGVDSAVAAALLVEAGYRVVGLTMSVYDGGAGACSSGGRGHACYGPEEEDLEAARAVAAHLGIAHHAIDVRAEYRTTVLDYFTGEYLQGRTPNPCVRCNPVVKFGFLIERAREQGVRFDRFATGHYVRVERLADSGPVVLKRGIDARKDQSYFLYGLRRDLLPDLIFPLGRMTKAEVRERARSLNLPVAERVESQDFMSEDYTTLFRPDELKPGPILDEAGQAVGRHDGIVRYTIGQRKGLKIYGPDPVYVVDIDAARNAVIVGPRERLLGSVLEADRLNWLIDPPPTGPVRITARIRSHHVAAPATLEWGGGNSARVTFEEPQSAITPGQAAVFYDGDLVLGGGIITTRQ